MSAWANADPNPNDSTPSLGICRGGSPHPVKVLDGYQVVADTISTSSSLSMHDDFNMQVHIGGVTNTVTTTSVPDATTTAPTTTLPETQAVERVVSAAGARFRPPRCVRRCRW